MSNPGNKSPGNLAAKVVRGQCVCGQVGIEIDFPAFWAWHDHTAATRHAHGAAYATYIGCWRSRCRVIEGEDDITRFTDAKTQSSRSFCARCGTPIFYERGPAATMLNIPRALFEHRTGREPRYHIGIDEVPDWAYGGEPLAPLKNFPGVVWARPQRRKPPAPEGMF